MSKRTRGTRRQPHRRPARRPEGPRVPRVASQLQADVELERSPVADESPAPGLAPAPSASPSLPNRLTGSGGSRRPNSLLAERAAAEYIYVGQDLRHIGLVAALIFGVLFALFLIVDVLRIVRL